MRKPFFTKASLAASMALVATLAHVSPAVSGSAAGGATEWTQLLNNGELVTMVTKSTEQINNQITQISQLAQQIQNQLRIY